MRQINKGYDNSPKKEFVDVIIKICGLYCLYKRRVVDLPAKIQITQAAKEAGWILEEEDQAVVDLVYHIAQVSTFKTPLMRPEKWNESLTMAALKRFS